MIGGRPLERPALQFPLVVRQLLLMPPFLLLLQWLML